MTSVKDQQKLLTDAGNGVDDMILPKKKPDNGPPNIYKDVKKLYKKVFGTKRGNPNKAFRNRKN